MNMVQFPSLLKSLQVEFKKEKIRPKDLNPWSTWFSYGSNLYSPDFESKMKKYGSNLSLLCPVRCTLDGKKYLRMLNNESSGRGLAYALHERPEATNGSELIIRNVEGVIHNVPAADLPAFLRFEGILDKCYRLRSEERRYNVKRVSVEVHPKKGHVRCFTLLGCSPLPEQKIKEKIKGMKPSELRELVSYVRTAIKGAVCLGIDIEPFERDIARIDEWRK